MNKMDSRLILNFMRANFNLAYLGIVFSLALTSKAQRAYAQTAEKGSVILHQNNEIENAVEAYKKFNYSSNGLEGYRIQIFSESGNDAKSKAEKVLSEYKSLYSTPIPYLTYQQPNFKVRCGNFRTRAEARKYIKSISAAYPSAFIVKEVIQPEQ
jgi:hypothetical protein